MKESLALESHPILSCQSAAAFEADLLAADDDVWRAMRRAGLALAEALRADYAMTREKQRGARLLGLIGKGHNGGDALLAIGSLLASDLLGSAFLVFSSPLEKLKPHTRRALQGVANSPKVELLAPRSATDEDFLPAVAERLETTSYQICLDGLLGMQFKPPLREPAGSLIKLIEERGSVGFRAAVDLPSGLADNSAEHPLNADFTYATGVLKMPLLQHASAGCIRYLDLGFFERRDQATVFRVTTERALDPLRRIRPPSGEKRTFGHLAILAGSRSMPGALLMATRAALSSGVGLVTVFAPESVVPHLAGLLPEAMWRAWPETPEGNLALEGLRELRSVEGKAAALLAGPGMGTEPETQALLREIARQWTAPAVLDADALRPEVVDAFIDAGNTRLVATPHDGEFLRLSGGEVVTDESARAYAREKGIVLVKKSSSTRVTDGERVFLNTTGNGVLSRGGSGDILAGLIGGLVAQRPKDTLAAACRGVFWHGKAADRLARERGQTAVRTTDLIDFFAPALEDAAVWNPDYPESKRSGR